MDSRVFVFLYIVTGISGDYPFRNTSLSWLERVDDLVSRLTLREIQDQMAHGGNMCPGIDRLGIPPYYWGTECLRGDGTDANATSYPQAIGLGAAFSGDYPFRNTSLPWLERVDDLVSRLTLREIQDQMAHGGNMCPGIDRLGIPPYYWGTECLRGDGTDANATSYPQAIGLGAAFSTDLIYRIAEATSIEVRAWYNHNSKLPGGSQHFGVSCFSPVINLVRDPRWGRNQETYGEDPHFNGVYAASFVRGLQGNDTRYVRNSACCKHYVAYDGPENIPVSRLSFDAKVSERDLRTTFLPSFRHCIGAGSMSVMCSYNSVNGVPACANNYTLTSILRDEWNFTGYVISDSGAIIGIKENHHYVNTNVDTAAVSINAGVNLELTGTGALIFENIVEAVNEGKLSEAIVRERVKKLFYAKMRLGIFDPPGMNPYSKIDMSVIENEAHRNLAVEAAMKSFVLLKNSPRFLPIKSNQFKTIAVIGPFADNKVDIIGNYAPHTDPKFITTVLDGLKTLAPNVQYASGCDDVYCKNYSSHNVTVAMEGAEAIFVCLGTGQKIETESHDRSDLDLPGYQLNVLNEAVAFSRSSAPVVLLLFNAGPVNMTWIDSMDRVVSVLECFLPAQAAGTAIRNILINEGPNSVPAGRLPYSCPLYATQIPPMVDYSMSGRTYRYLQTKPLFPFGFGLSYTFFNYSQLRYPKTVHAGDDLIGSVLVKNIGDYDADEVIQVYLTWKEATVPTPQIQLADFHRVHVKVGEEAQVNFRVTAEVMAVWMDVKGWVVEKGLYDIFVGGQQPYQARAVRNSNILRGQFQISSALYLGVY